ncbi:MAG: GNAT family N-acetyltransferase [Propionibacteriaceae bacterium]|nr:GNAT family N-acetyltransferase [Propionibacteriaceae bacterium]
MKDISFLFVPAVASVDDGEYGWMYEGIARLTVIESQHRAGNADDAQTVQELVADRADETQAKAHWIIAQHGTTPSPEAVVGFAMIVLFTTYDREKARLWFCVHPDYRGQGIGSALLEQFETISRADGRMILLSPVLFGPAEDTDAPQIGFFTKRGYVIDLVDRGSVLALPLDEVRVAELMASVEGHNDGYRLHTWISTIPEQWMESFARLQEAFIRDLPRGDVNWDEEVWDRERVERRIARLHACGMASALTVAEEIASGTLVGYTELRWTPSASNLAADQYVTIVLNQHRGHRLGLWLKLVNLAAAQEVCPSLARIHTFNATINEPMLAVNVAMGFQGAGGCAQMAKVVASDPG